MNTAAAPAKSKTWLWVTLAVVLGSCGLCTVSVLFLGLSSVIASGGELSNMAAATPGGFKLAPPAAFKEVSPGRFLQQWQEQDRDEVKTYSVEGIHLPAVDGVDDPEAAVAQLWTTAVANDWKEADNAPLRAPLVMRRYVQNGARAWFASAELRPKNGTALSLVTLLLVQVDEQLEPLVLIQSFSSTFDYIQKDEFARYSWKVSFPQVEAFLTGVEGSPTGLPIATDEEVTGTWRYGSGSNLQWVNTFTGATSMTAVSYTIQYDLDDDHHYRYQFGSASGTVGALQFDGEKAEGTWAVERDLLVVTSDQGKVKRFLIVGAPKRDGKRGLYLYPEPFSIAPPAIRANAELYTSP